MKLTDTHRTVLAAAGARANLRVLPLPKSVKLPGAKKDVLLSSLLKAELVAEELKSDSDVEWRSDDSGKFTLVVTSAGLDAIGIESDGEAHHPGALANLRKRPKAKAPTKVPAKKASRKSLSPSPTPEPRAGSKLETLIALLRSKKGATIEELVDATGWQAHSVRGAISGALKKKRSLKVISEPFEGRGRVYRIAE